ncbi:phosphoribosylformylglycinamidine cyclo-ligase [Candidatus Peregrinibacteria bacterium]|jgi:phosphoribosylformylglycinamidine cyclo-ligase|nr:phosphoribosylformylglycinamidine cyclo-ligase [Candidatus Peregrinibacteria bacterium]MBT4147708.1 phosphoribosylformylglycinamidine cyclo-ligase [Candidatus Peregrinibacteria bacterium]MBT4455747.1 phosphoribosylformylglycinamidine cyclo-ligase [Candidatus Peregrinibacteria bacterium]
MATYADSGVDIEKGDEASRLAYENAKKTFASRKGMIGEPLVEEGGFTGALDMGEYLLVQNDDGVGTKIEVAERIKKFDTLGYDLVAMVADDAACVGAECISISNTIDTNKVDASIIGPLTEGLAKACIENKIVVPGGEIAELGNAVNGNLWNATAVGVLQKDKRITGENLAQGDVLIGLHSAGFRSNGFSLVRHILKEAFGEQWHNESYDENTTWGEAVLTPSIIYHQVIMALHGRYKEPTQVTLKGVVHVTGGGIQGNLDRILKKTDLKADLSSLPEPHEPMKKLMELGNVSKDEAYKTWNMGVGMILIVSPEEAEKTLQICEQEGYKASQIGQIQ